MVKLVVHYLSRGSPGRIYVHVEGKLKHASKPQHLMSDAGTLLCVIVPSSRGKGKLNMLGRANFCCEVGMGDDSLGNPKIELTKPLNKIPLEATLNVLYLHPADEDSPLRVSSFRSWLQGRAEALEGSICCGCPRIAIPLT